MELLTDKLNISCEHIASALRWEQAALPQVGPPVPALIWDNLLHRLLLNLSVNSSYGENV
jgi:hypothetical protein